MELSKMIPEIYYDLLGRVIPGAIALSTWSYALGIDWVSAIVSIYAGSKVLSDSILVITTTILIIVYLIGYIISPLSHFTHSKILSRVFPAYFNVLQTASTMGPNQYPSDPREFFYNEVSHLHTAKDGKISTSEYRRITYLWYDMIRLTDPTAGTRIAKIRAEYRMLEGIYVVFGVAFILSAVSSLLIPTRLINWPYAVGCAIATIVFAWNAARLFQTFQWAVINHYYHLKKASLTATTSKEKAKEKRS